MPTLCVYVYVYVLIFEGVCKRHHAHITIERLPRQLLPRCLQCLLEYGRRRINTCPIFPQSPPIRIGPRTSTGSVAAGWHGLALLQLLPLVSNKHMISLSLSLLFSVSFLFLFYLFALSAFACCSEVTVTSVSLPPFESRRGLSTTNQRLSCT